MDTQDQDTQQNQAESKLKYRIEYVNIFPNWSLSFLYLPAALICYFLSFRCLWTLISDESSSGLLNYYGFILLLLAATHLLSEFDANNFHKMKIIVENTESIQQI